MGGVIHPDITKGKNTMRIGLIDVDGHSGFPNIPLMKISAWHKSLGDEVEWYEPLFSGHMDIVYMSKVFSNSPDYQYYVDSDKVIRGGQRVLCKPRRRERGIQTGERKRITAGNRTHLPGLQYIRDYGYRIRLFNKGLPARMRFLPCGSERGQSIKESSGFIGVLERTEKHCVAGRKYNGL